MTTEEYEEGSCVVCGISTARRMGWFVADGMVPSIPGRLDQLNILSSLLRRIAVHEGKTEEEVVVGAVEDFVRRKYTEKDYDQPIWGPDDERIMGLHFERPETANAPADAPPPLGLGAKVARLVLPDPDDCPDAEVATWLRNAEEDAKQIRIAYDAFEQEERPLHDKLKVRAQFSKVVDQYEVVIRRLKRRALVVRGETPTYQPVDPPYVGGVRTQHRLRGWMFSGG